MRTFVAFLAGALFSVGLVLGGMTQPSKVIGFLDLTGNWDPSLAFVMGGGLVVYGVGLRLALRRSKPILEGRFQVPTRRDLTPRLAAGSALFGLGWGLAGFCPGPALASLGALSINAVIFVPAMMTGMTLFRWYDQVVQRRSVRAGTTLLSTAKEAGRPISRKGVKAQS